MDTPLIEISSNEFTPDFPADVSAGNYPSEEKQASDFEPTIPAKYLRSFSNMEIDFNMERAKDKTILICFFDYEQRPSRNCILQLNKSTKEFKEEDIVVIAIHASKTEQSKLDEWVEEQKIFFPVGMIKADEKQTRFNWGVKSMPWLILTDKEHIVKAEGFNINELDEKITALREK